MVFQCLKACTWSSVGHQFPCLVMSWLIDLIFLCIKYVEYDTVRKTGTTAGRAGRWPRPLSYCIQWGPQAEANMAASQYPLGHRGLCGTEFNFNSWKTHFSCCDLNQWLKYIYNSPYENSTGLNFRTVALQSQVLIITNNEKHISLHLIVLTFS